MGMYLTIMAFAMLSGPPISGAIISRTGGYEVVGIYAGLSSAWLFLNQVVVVLKIPSRKPCYGGIFVDACRSISCLGKMDWQGLRIGYIFTVLNMINHTLSLVQRSESYDALWIYHIFVAQNPSQDPF
jgi:hypothetical protein